MVITLLKDLGKFNSQILIDLRLLTCIQANYYTPRITIYNAQIIGLQWGFIWPGRIITAMATTLLWDLGKFDSQISIDLQLLIHMQANYYTLRIMIYSTQIIGLQWASSDLAGQGHDITIGSGKVWFNSQVLKGSTSGADSFAQMWLKYTTSGEFQRVLQLDQA